MVWLWKASCLPFRIAGSIYPTNRCNCLILARAEAFAFKNGVLDSALDGIGMGLGFTLALTVLGAVREIFGAGAIFGITLFGEAFEPALIMILPPGAFLALGLILAGINAYQAKKAKALASQKLLRKGAHNNGKC